MITEVRTANSPDLKFLQRELEAIQEKMNQAVDLQRPTIAALHPAQKLSAENLIRYLTLRSDDIRNLQDHLHIAGLSSLASSESHILRQLQAILQRLGREIETSELSACDYLTGSTLIRHRSTQLFGEKNDPSIPYLMVTFDSEFADNFQLIKKLLDAGMNIARINCAHDDEETWRDMIDLVHEASKRTRIPCKIYMDLGGPKLRTGLLGRGRRVGKASLMEGQELMLAEKDSDYDPSAVVISCSEPNIIRQLKPGERVLFDDGIIETIVQSNANGIAALRIVRISGKKPQIKTGKGINFPDSELDLPALTERDRSLLPFICEHADLVGYSFVREAEGVMELQKMLGSHSTKPHMIIKIETPQAVKNLPSLLIQGMMDEVFGVMIARGDLAVEIGFERMSEIQEEISWICEAAHAPVIWATQVLETMNKSGIATRSEITDASHAAMAECVMINKGDHIIKVLKTLTDILKRTGGHHVKKRYTFRPMQIAKNYFLIDPD
ncbi:MAG TPA: pyruvate kinase [Cyclobacteriaceae bacterium]|nr:pyruvate kinase [Cyclobacteriaceae bacterium]